MDILDQLRIGAGLRVKELADLSDVSESSLRKMIRGEGVSGVLVYKCCEFSLNVLDAT